MAEFDQILTTEQKLQAWFANFLEAIRDCKRKVIGVQCAIERPGPSSVQLVALVQLRAAKSARKAGRKKGE